MEFVDQWRMELKLLMLAPSLSLSLTLPPLLSLSHSLTHSFFLSLCRSSLKITVEALKLQNLTNSLRSTGNGPERTQRAKPHPKVTVTETAAARAVESLRHFPHHRPHLKSQRSKWKRTARVRPKQPLKSQNWHWRSLKWRVCLLKEAAQELQEGVGLRQMENQPASGLPTLIHLNLASRSPKNVGQKGKKVPAVGDSLAPPPVSPPPPPHPGMERKRVPRTRDAG